MRSYITTHINSLKIMVHTATDTMDHSASLRACDIFKSPSFFSVMFCLLRCKAMSVWYTHNNFQTIFNDSKWFSSSFNAQLCQVMPSRRERRGRGVWMEQDGWTRKHWSSRRVMSIDVFAAAGQGLGACTIQPSSILYSQVAGDFQHRHTSVDMRWQDKQNAQKVVVCIVRSSLVFSDSAPSLCVYSSASIILSINHSKHLPDSVCKHIY